MSTTASRKTQSGGRERAAPVTPALPYLAEVLRRGERGAHEAADGLGRLRTGEALKR